MSSTSDSDDDYSYTNSVSVLKALTKKDVSIGSDIDTSKNEINFFETPKRNLGKRIEPQSIELIDEESKTIDLDKTDKSAEDTLIKEIRNINDSCILLSDEDAERPPVNILSAIDDVLQSGSRKKRGRKKATPRQTRQSKIIKKAAQVIQNDSLLDISTEISDEEPNRSLSAIDDLQCGRSRKKRGKKQATPRQTRQSKRLTKAAHVIQNDSLLDTSAGICIVEDSPDINEINYELTVKVYWKSQSVEKFSMRRFDKLTSIFKYFSEKENISENRLLFTINNKIISKNDTPNGLNITVATIIEGGILSGQTDLTDSKTQDEHLVEFKVQTTDRKHPLLISLKPEDKMEVLMYQCAQELNIPMKSLKFYFDGDLIKPSDTPETLDLEGSDIIDCIRF